MAMPLRSKVPGRRDCVFGERHFAARYYERGITMRKLMLAFLFVPIVFLAACGSREREDSSALEMNNGSADLAEKDNTFNDIYYKLEVEDKSSDINCVLDYFLGDIDTYTDEIKAQEYNEDVEFTEYTLNMNGNEYKWFADGEVIDFFINSGDGHKPIEDYELARKQAEDFVHTLGIDMVLMETLDYSSVPEAEGELVYRFAQTYEGTPITYENARVGKDIMNGPMLSISVDGDGIRAVNWIFGYLRIENILDEYSRTELISAADAEERVIKYSKGLWKQEGFDEDQIHINITDTQIVYIPSAENNKKVLIPAYQLRMEGTIDGKEEPLEGTYVVDAFTGLVSY